MDLTLEPLIPFATARVIRNAATRNLRLATPTLACRDAATTTVDVENVGRREGDEFVQVYVTDIVTSATWLNKSLEPLGPFTWRPERGERCR